MKVVCALKEVCWKDGFTFEKNNKVRKGLGRSEELAVVPICMYMLVSQQIPRHPHINHLRPRVHVVELPRLRLDQAGRLSKVINKGAIALGTCALRVRAQQVIITVTSFGVGRHGYSTRAVQVPSRT